MSVSLKVVITDTYTVLADNRAEAHEAWNLRGAKGAAFHDRRIEFVEPLPEPATAPLPGGGTNGD